MNITFKYTLDCTIIRAFCDTVFGKLNYFKIKYTEVKEITQNENISSNYLVILQIHNLTHFHGTKKDTDKTKSCT